MRSMLSLASPGVAAITTTLSGQTQTDKPPLPKGQMPELDWPTKVGDQLPPLNFDAYFLGRWTFDWDVPEGALGPYSGKTLRIERAMRLLSPLNDKAATTLSVDGGPFRNHGNPWWRTDAAGSK